MLSHTHTTQTMYDSPASPYSTHYFYSVPVEAISLSRESATRRFLSDNFDAPTSGSASGATTTTTPMMAFTVVIAVDAGRMMQLLAEQGWKAALSTRLNCTVIQVEAPTVHMVTRTAWLEPR